MSDNGEDSLLLWPGFEDAFVGTVERCGLGPVACYDYGKMIDVLVTRDGMDPEEAHEFLAFNYVGGYVGLYTPFVLYPSSEPPDGS